MEEDSQLLITEETTAQPTECVVDFDGSRPINYAEESSTSRRDDQQLLEVPVILPQTIRKPSRYYVDFRRPFPWGQVVYRAFLLALPCIPLLVLIIFFINSGSYLMILILSYLIPLAILSLVIWRCFLSVIKENACFWRYWLTYCWCRISPKSSNIIDDLPTALLRYVKSPPFENSRALREAISQNVYMMLILNTLNESLPELFFTIEPSGSLRERFGKSLPSSSVLASDYDMMLVANRLLVSFEVQKQPIQAIPQSTFLAQDHSRRASQDSQVYYKLLLSDETHEYLANFVLDVHKGFGQADRQYYLSSEAVIAKVKSSIEKVSNWFDRVQFISNGSDMNYDTIECLTVSHGPAVTVLMKGRQANDKTLFVKLAGGYYCESCCGPLAVDADTRVILEADFTLSLPCLEWPPETSNWFQRPHHWIEPETMDNLRRRGLHFVPKRSKDLATEFLRMSESTDYPGLDWRISFSLPEALISDSVPEMVRIAYMAFKAIRKRYRVNIPDLTSYHLKTTLLLYLDDLKPCQVRYLNTTFDRQMLHGGNFASLMNNEAFGNIFLGLLSKVITFLVAKHLPHYWVANENLLSQIPEQSLIDASKQFQRVQREPIKYLIDENMEMQQWIMNLTARRPCQALRAMCSTLCGRCGCGGPCDCTPCCDFYCPCFAQNCCCLHDFRIQIGKDKQTY